MELLLTFYYISVVFWVFIPFRQYRTRFFIPFLLLALSDPFYIALFQFVRLKSDDYYLVVSIIFLYLILFDLKTRGKIILIAAFTIIVIPFFLYKELSTEIFTLTVHSYIFIIFLKIMTIYFSQQRKILVFHLTLVTYQFTLLLKFFVSITNVEVGALYYMVTSLIQIVFAILFLILNENSKAKISFEKLAE